MRLVQRVLDACRAMFRRRDAKLRPDETLLTGAWVMRDGRMVGDETCMRIEAVCSRLQHLGVDASGWDRLYRDNRDGRLWDYSYPRGAMPNGGPPQLRCVTEDEARRKYRLGAAPPTYFEQLRRAVARLAASADEQAAWLSEIRTYPSADELAMDFGDLFRTRWRLRDEHGLPEEAAAVLEELDAKLASFSGQSFTTDWHASALALSPHWAEVRAIAGRTLETLDSMALSMSAE